jgi:hypothetical protein
MQTLDRKDAERDANSRRLLSKMPWPRGEPPHQRWHYSICRSLASMRVMRARLLVRFRSLVGKSDVEVREAIGDKFPKHIYHSIVCIGALIAHREADHWWTRKLPTPENCPTVPMKVACSTMVTLILVAL